MGGSGGDTSSTAYPRRRRPICPLLLSRRPPAPPVAEVAAFESCMLTMRTERGVGLRPPEKGTGVCWRHRPGLGLHLPLPLPLLSAVAAARWDRRSQTSLLC